jgi:uncharacterized protein (TIGR03083 family)
LLALLAGLDSRDWDRPTAAPRWSVKDVVAHLLGGDVGVLSRERDAYTPSKQRIEDYRDLVQLVDRLNDEWVVAARRLSPRVLCDALAFTGPQVEAYFGSLDLHAVAGPVSWAGPEAAPVWFDVAREFTERWHHQQQIRDATAQPPLYDPYFLGPVLATFTRSLPNSFRGVAAPIDSLVRFEISGEAGGVWLLQNRGPEWVFTAAPTGPPVTDVVVPQEIAWRLFTKGVDRQHARSQAVIRGDADLASPVFAATAIIG